MILSDYPESSHGEECFPYIITKKFEDLFLWTAINTKFSHWFRNTQNGVWKYVPCLRPQAAAFLESVKWLSDMW